MLSNMSVKRSMLHQCEGDKACASVLSMLTVLCTLYSVLCTLYSVPCTLYPVLCTLCSVLCALCSVLCTDKHHAAGVQLRASSAVAGNETLEALRHRQRLEARAAEEEDLMVRVPLSKEQKKQLKADRRVNLSGAAMMNDFADDVADLVGVSSLSLQHFTGLYKSVHLCSHLPEIQTIKQRPLMLLKFNSNSTQPNPIQLNSTAQESINCFSEACCTV